VRFAEFLLSKISRVTLFICILLLGEVSITPQTASNHAQSPASAAGQDDSARPLEIADSSPSSATSPDKRSQIGEQSQMLLKMALDLEKEVNRTTAKTISAAALRKADQIEKFVKELTTGGHENASR
jgi:hypothetical protein